MTHVLLGTAAHGVPLRPVADLEQSMVVAKANQGGDGKAQHLIRKGRTRCINHGQQIVAAKCFTESMLVQKILY